MTLKILLIYIILVQSSLHNLLHAQTGNNLPGSVADSHVSEYANDTNNKLAYLVKPLKNFITTSGFGVRYHPILHQWMMHNGIDLRSDNDTVFAIFQAKIDIVAHDQRAGIYIKFKHGPVVAGYAHLSQSFVLPGQTELQPDNLSVL